MTFRTALRSVALALVFMTGVSLYAFWHIFRRLEELDNEAPRRRPADPWRVLP